MLYVLRRLMSSAVVCMLVFLPEIASAQILGRAQAAVHRPSIERVPDGV